jgi:hypothetical protein
MSKWTLRTELLEAVADRIFLDPICLGSPMTTVLLFTTTHAVACQISARPAVLLADFLRAPSTGRPRPYRSYGPSPTEHD